jgi:hypothetical protein
MKKKSIILFLIVIIVLIIYVLNPGDIPILPRKSSTSDITETVNIKSHKLKVTYYKGNLIDETIGYANSYEKVLKIENTSNESVSYSINLSDSEINNDKLVYTIFYSEDNITYNSLQEERSVTRDFTLIYNLGAEISKPIYIKIVFKALSDEADTILKGRISVKENLTKKDIFINDVVSVQNAILEHFEKINWLSNPGIFTVNVKDLGIQDLSINGYVVIDASYISDIEYFYFVYSDSYMLDEYKYDNSFNKSNIKELDQNRANEYNDDSVCRTHSKKPCSRFLDLSINTGSSKKTFKENVETVIDLVKKDFDTSRKEVVIYNVENDINNPTNVKGYILINNSEGKEEYYLYLTDYSFMISGYNLTKLGPVLTSNKTIKTYIVDSYNLSSESASKVCSFTGMSDCKEKNGNIIN